MSVDAVGTFMMACIFLERPLDVGGVTGVLVGCRPANAGVITRLLKVFSSAGCLKVLSCLADLT